MAARVLHVHAIRSRSAVMRIFVGSFTNAIIERLSVEFLLEFTDENRTDVQYTYRLAAKARVLWLQ